jgi:hypothetical protein
MRLTEPVDAALDALTPALPDTRSMTSYAAELGRYRDGWDALPKCVRCLLPEQFRFIEFDDEGVCNYCHAHERVIEETKDQQMRMRLGAIVAEHCLFRAVTTTASWPTAAGRTAPTSSGS